MTNHWSHGSAGVDPTTLALRLSGAQNFREVGSYPTRGGGHVRRGLIWRSAKLDELTEADVAMVAALGIALVADLRQPSERDSAPTTTALLASTKVLTWDLEYEVDERQIKRFNAKGANEAECEMLVVEFYRRIPDRLAPHLTDVFRAAADGELPLLIHCSAGKDRTGVAVALLLKLLDVEPSAIMADYVATARLLDWSRLASSAALGAGAGGSWFANMDPVMLAVISDARECFLTAALDEVDRTYGSVEQFAVDRLGLTRNEIASLRNRLIEERPDIGPLNRGRRPGA